jgi:hypothetical protein
LKNVFNTLFIFLLISCASNNNYSNSVSYKGKVLVNPISFEQSSFNILLTSNKNNTIIQIKKPFYGNVIQIKINNSENLMKYITKEGSYEIKSNIPKNIEILINNCIFKNSFNFSEILDNQIFDLECSKENDRTNFYVEYKNSYYEGFLIKNE